MAEYWCSPNVNATGFTPLMLNVLENKIEPENLKDINAKNSSGWTALMITSRNSSTWCSNELVKTLLDNGADPNIQTNEGSTTLMISARSSNIDSNTETVRILLEYGADPNIQNNDGFTALMLAARNSDTDSNLETVEILLEYGTNFNLKKNNGFTALMLATRYSDNGSNLKTARILLENGADLEDLEKEDLKKIYQIQKEMLEESKEKNRKLETELNFKPGYPGAHQAEERFRILQGKPRRRSNSF